MKVLFFGDSDQESTARHRAGALRRLGHEVTVFDPHRQFGRVLRHRLWGAIHVRTGFRLLQAPMLGWLRSLAISPGSFDLIWVNGGELFGAGCLAYLRTLSAPLALYNNDDPTGARDGRHFDSLRQAISRYDLCAIRCERDVSEFHALGARHLIQIWMSYDEVAHAPFASEADIPEKFRSEVAFVGAWIRHERRDEFLLKLADAGIAIAIWGNRWEKSPNWARIRPFYRGKSIAGRDYVAALQGAKVCIGLVSKANRDLHTRRSVEVPYAGGLLCAERTAKHEILYRDGEEAVFWTTAEECAARCQELLADPVRREAIRQAGRRRVLELKLGNEDVCRRILAELPAAGR